jgi:parvulin-like peptidyl-prolyl isomerase
MKRNHRSAALAFALAVLGLTARAEPESAGLLYALSLLDAKEKATLAGDPALLKQVVQLTHAQQLLLREARDQKWEERPEVKARLERAKETALAESWLQSVSEPPPDYPSTDELRAVWEKRRASFATPRQFRLAQIFIPCPKGAPAEMVEKAQTKLAKVKARLDSPTDDFATVARTESEDAASRDKGGEIGWLTEAQIQPELRAPIIRLREHGISEPVRLNDGWHILKCLAKREARTPELTEVQATLVAQLRAEKATANSEAHVSQLLQAHPLNVDEAALAGALRTRSP